jgi:DNA-binding XRE family transcriptional regulator
MLWRVCLVKAAGSLGTVKNNSRHVLTPHDLQVRVGRAISAIRKSRGFTQEEVANQVGIGWRHIQKIEAGEINTTLRTIFRIATVLGVDPIELFKEGEAP